jgi:hypothetical protein
MGIVGLAFAGLPFAAAGLSADFTTYPSYADRMTLPSMLPASLIMVGLVAVLGKTRLSRGLLVSLILFSCSAFQVQNESLYRHDWMAQKMLFWQFAWRAPALKQGTSILADGMPGSLYANHSAGLLNMLYKRDDSAGRLDYYFFDLHYLSTEEQARTAMNLRYTPGNSIFGNLRSFKFQGSTAQSLVAWISPSGTLRIVTKDGANEILRCTALCANISPRSRPEELISDAPGLPDGPLLRIFGPEPKHECLYFYQKAELERQLKHWEAVAALGDQVMGQGYKPVDPSEWFPFIDGFARAARYQTAIDLSNRLLEENPDAITPLSSLWLRVERDDNQRSSGLRSALHILGDKLVLKGLQ